MVTFGVRYMHLSYRVTRVKGRSYRRDEQDLLSLGG